MAALLLPVKNRIWSAVASGRFLFLVFSCLVCLHSFGNAHDTTSVPKPLRRVPDEQRLYETIMTRYQQSVMPHMQNASHTLTVAFSLRLNQIVTLDERKQVLTTNVFIDQAWIDPGLAWDPNNFTDVRALRIPAEHVWLPDTFVYNNADEHSGFMRGTYVQIQSSGRVLWPVPMRLKSSCKVQITYFPFDSQICRLRFGSWIYGMDQLDYTPLVDGLTVDPSTYVNNSEWELVSITMTKALHPAGGPGGTPRREGPHPHLTYVLHLKRNTFFYLFNIIVPCVMLSTLNILTFWLPPISGEKVTLGLSVFLAFSMFMLLIAEEVPATSEAVPLIGVYLCMVMTMTSLSVIMAVVVTNLYHRGRKMRRAPRWLVLLCLDWLARPCCVLNDIPLIASTVDLAEHCQYDVSNKMKPQPRLAQVLKIPTDTTTPTTTTTTTTTASAAAALQDPQHNPPRQNPRVIPTHLQNGGHVGPGGGSSSRVQTLARRQRPGDEEEGDAPGIAENHREQQQQQQQHQQQQQPQNRDLPPSSSSSALSSFFSAMGGSTRRSAAAGRELHPRARNSVTTSCRFTRLPTTADGDLQGDHCVDTAPEEEADEEEEVWVQRTDVNSYHSSESELARYNDVHQEEDGGLGGKGKYREDGGGRGGEGEDEESGDVWQKLLTPNTENDTHHQELTADESEDHAGGGGGRGGGGGGGGEEESEVWQRLLTSHPDNTNDATTFHINNQHNNPTPTTNAGDEPYYTNPLFASSSIHSLRNTYKPSRQAGRGRGRRGRRGERRRGASSSLTPSPPEKLEPHPSCLDVLAARTLIAEWQQIATVVDRLMFVVYVLTTVTAYVVILLVAPANQPPVTDLMLDAEGVHAVTQVLGR